MDARRALVTQVLDQLIKALRDLSDEDFDRLMTGDLEASISFVRPSPRNRNRRPAAAPADDAALAAVHARLTAAGSREEGQRIRDKVVTQTVGRRLSGRAARGGGGMVAGEDA